jgi:RNA polymerase sigma-70 factor (ECF subfamily)
MAGRPATGTAGFAVEEERLARAAAAGDGSAFASLYEHYEQRIYNFAYRLTGSEPDAAETTQEAFLAVMRRLPKAQGGELHFRLSLFSAVRNACYDLMEKRPRARPKDTKPETAQAEVREACMRLPEHQREALALRELEELSYEEIAAIMETNRNAVAQLISRARINLSDELLGTPLAAVATPSPECERALPLIAARADGQLEAGSDDDAWLDAHLAGCERCRLGVKAMEEAGASYRAWAPLAVAPSLLGETMAKAGGGGGEELAAATASRTDPRSPSGVPSAYSRDDDGAGRSSRRRRLIPAAGLAALLLGAGIAIALVDGEPAPIRDRSAADTRAVGSAPKSGPRKEKRGRGKASRSETTAQATTGTSSQQQTEAEGGAPSEPVASPVNQQGASGLQPPQATATPKPNSKPQPAPASQPAAAPASPTTEPLPTAASTTTEEPSHGKGKGPPSGVSPQGPK